jgi:hypothetical protein
MHPSEQASERASNRTLADVVAEVHVIKNNRTADTVRLGALLIEIKAEVPRGQFESFIEDEFSFSKRTAENYMAAHRFVSKLDPPSATVALKLPLKILYALARGEFRPPAEAAILEAAANGTKINEKIADQIARAHEPCEVAIEDFDDAFATLLDLAGSVPVTKLVGIKATADQLQTVTEFFLKLTPKSELQLEAVGDA